MFEARHLLVYGKVQGIGYRYFASRAAQMRGLVGWVRNLPDGRVEALAEGETEALESFIEELRKGPPYSQVTCIDTEQRPAKGTFSGFEIQNR